MTQKLFFAAALMALALPPSFASAQGVAASAASATTSASPSAIAPAPVNPTAPPRDEPAATPPAAPPSAAKPAPAPAADIETAILDSSKDYRIGPEDLLDISVWKNPELSRTVPVRPDGKVSLPLVNDIQ